ncbi:hypothetical protein HXZ65_05475 [Acinetobacter indicus]|uniref:hypothetical protein n=1 Tax=Acinetobacter indicus TaxID=756892 RepID=UPI0025782B58|nr:hypothetical protein [Acinetobacter indicus]MDM1277703.1 hypothetical protein [Acinetobacter indicus]
MSEPKYSGKPLAYLDQNILDSFLKAHNKDENFIQGFLSRVQVVYSDVTLQEIHLAGINNSDYTKKFLQLLGDINAHHISLELDENWKPLDTIRGSSNSPFHHYQFFLENRQYDELIHEHKKNIFALYGGITDFNQLAIKQLCNQNELLNDLENQLKHLRTFNSNDPIIIQFIEEKEIELQVLESQMPDFENNVNFTTQKLEEANCETDAHIAFRRELGINIDKIKTIQFPNVVEKIWKSIQSNNDYLKNIDFNTFCQIDSDINNRNRKLTDFEKIHAIYTILNLIGYMPEKKVKNEGKFIASDRDISHVAYASYCHFFITNDERLLNKSRAIYEYLNIQTEVLKFPL